MKKYLLISALLGFVSTQAHAALVAAYTFDETSGTTATDSVRGATGNATLLNGAAFAAGQMGNALTLDGTNDWASALNPVVNGQQQLTVSAWVNVSVRTDWGTIVKDWADTATFHFGLQSTSMQFSNFIGGSGSGSVATSAGLNTNSWYHVAFTFDDATNTQKIYLNGLEAGSTTATAATLTTGGGTMGIGASTVPGQFLNGKIDDLMFYDNALTAGDVTAIYNNGLAGVSAVPEPSTYGLIGAGALAGVAFVRRRRRDAGKAA